MEINMNAAPALDSEFLNSVQNINDILDKVVSLTELIELLEQAGTRHIINKHGYIQKIAEMIDSSVDPSGQDLFLRLHPQFEEALQEIQARRQRQPTNKPSAKVGKTNGQLTVAEHNFLVLGYPS